jgi:hypothetical protein
MDVDGCDLIFRRATMVTVCVDVSRASVYAITLPTSGYIYKARNGGSGAVYVLPCRSFFILIHPLGLLQIHATRPSQSNLRFTNERYFGGSGRGSMHRHFTNALLAWAPTVVHVDPQEPESFYLDGANGRRWQDS